MVKDICHFLGLKIFHGLSLSPRIEWKFKSQHEDSVHGNDFISIGLDQELNST
jgi:hypothetical protein